MSAGQRPRRVARQVLQPGYTAIVNKQGPPWPLYRVLTILSLTWTGGESLRYARISTRRQRIGLSDPGVTNRFVLWATCTLICALLSTETMLVDPSLSNSLMGVTLQAPAALAQPSPSGSSSPNFYMRWLMRKPA